jgi:hypothetical protein
MELDNNSAMIVGDPRGILGQQLRPYPVHVFFSLETLTPSIKQGFQPSTQKLLVENSLADRHLANTMLW